LQGIEGHGRMNGSTAEKNHEEGAETFGDRAGTQTGLLMHGNINNRQPQKEKTSL
jgi:hypothetical protein